MVDSFNSSLASLITSGTFVIAGRTTWFQFQASILSLDFSIAYFLGVSTDLSCLHLAAVNNRDAESSKSAFVSSATALEKWIVSAGLGGQLKGY
jgi:hypothetical protein